MAATHSQRRRARAARHAERAAPLPQDLQPVRPGLAGGRYQPLGAAELQRVHCAALEILASIGMADAIPSCRELITAAGGRVDEHGRLLFPAALVEDTIAGAARNFVLHGATPEHDLALRDSRVHYGTAGAAVQILDSDNRTYRDSNLANLYDAARLTDALEHIHFFQRPLVARDMTNARELDLNTCYACVAGTRKHVGTSFVSANNVAEAAGMLHAIAGDEARWRSRPFVSNSNCFVVPPLRFAGDACRVLEAAVRHGMPVLLLAAGQAGATSPAALAGALAQEVAEVLAGLVYVNLLRPGHPAIFGSWPFISDLRTGAMSGGSGEQAVLMAACAQMARFYDLPAGVAAGMTDSKLPDAQAGYEKAYSNALAGHAGANLVYEAAGMHASLLGFAFESLVLDNDLLGAVMRTIRGIEVSDESLSIEVIRRVCVGGPNHFLGDPQTLALMQRDYLYPQVADRSSPKEWAERGANDILQRARRRAKEILATHYPHHIDPVVDRCLRERFPIRLPRAIMRAC